MAPEPNPAVLDDPMQIDLDDVDDLFGDKAELDLGIPPPARKRLHERIDELRSHGCCQSIAWSKAGTIASITPDGCQLEFRMPRVNPSDGSWELSRGTVCTLVSGSAAAPLVHLAWSSTPSPDLAVVDAAGRVTILSVPVALNLATVSRRWDGDAAGDDLHAVVGCLWLPLQMPANRQYHIFHGPALRSDHPGHYQYFSQLMHASGPSHPAPGRSALVTVTSNGRLRLFYLGRSGRIDDATMELESINTSDDIITHSAMCCDKQNILLVLALASGQLRLLHINLQWSPSLGHVEPGKLAGPTPLTPILTERHICTTSWNQMGRVSENDPSHPDDHDHDHDHAHNHDHAHANGTGDLQPAPQVTHLEILPSVLDGKERRPPLVLVIRSRLPAPTASSSDQGPVSVLDRFRIIPDQAQALHPALYQLGGGGSSSSSSSAGADSLTETRMERLPQLVVSNKIMIGVHAMHFGKVVCLSYADGSVEYRDRLTMEELYLEPSLEKLITLQQCGFAFPEQVPCLQTAHSPSDCSMVLIRDNGEVRWNRLRFMFGEIGSTRKDAYYCATIAALTLAILTSITNNSSYDDILATVRPLAGNSRLTQDLLFDLFKTGKFVIDYTEEVQSQNQPQIQNQQQQQQQQHDNILANQGMAVAFSIMNHFGFQGEHEPRKFIGKFGNLALHVKNIVLVITMASNPSSKPGVQQKPNPFDEPEAIDAFAGCTRWSLDLFGWIINSLVEIEGDPVVAEMLRSGSVAPPQRLGALMQGRNNVALQLVMCSSTRTLLTILTRRLNHIESISRRAVEFWESQSAPAQPALQAAYRRLQAVVSAAPVRSVDFQRLLSTISADVRATYAEQLSKLMNQKAAQQQPGQGQLLAGKKAEEQRRTARIQAELHLLLSPGPTLTMMTPVQKLLGTHLAAFRAASGYDRAAVFFGNWELLDVTDDERELARRRAQRLHVDSFRRVEVRGPPDPAEAAVLEAWADKAVASLHVSVANFAAMLGFGLWRRCVRCAAVMENMFLPKPGFIHIVKSQSRCPCGGHWAILEDGATVA